MLHLRNVLVAVFVVLVPLQDLGLRNTSFGILGASLSVFPLACLLLLAGVRWIFREEWDIPLSVLLLAPYVVAINTISFLRFGSSALGINLFSKTFTVSILTVLWLFVMFGIDFTSVPRLGLYLKLAFFLTILGILVGDLHIAGLGPLVNNAIIHGTANTDERWRGLTSEASQLAPLSISVGLLAAHYAKRRSVKLVLAGMSFMVMVTSGSKGGILTLGITALLLAVTTRVRMRTIFKASLLVIPILYLASIRLASVSTRDVLQETTTVATRGTVAVWGLSNLLSNPQGLGFGGYYAALERSIPAAMEVVYHYAPFPVNFSEVETYAVSAQNATTKIFFLDAGLFLGLPFLLWFARKMWRHVNSLNVSRNLLLLTAFWYVTVAMCSYTGGPTTYSSFLVFGVVVSESRKLQNPSRC